MGKREGEGEKVSVCERGVECVCGIGEKMYEQRVRGGESMCVRGDRECVWERWQEGQKV